MTLTFLQCTVLLTLARTCAAKGYCSRYTVCRSVCPHVFSRTVAAVDTKRGYVGMCNGRSAQQESGAQLDIDMLRLMARLGLNKFSVPQKVVR